jgi:hypothetical protein
VRERVLADVRPVRVGRQIEQLVEVVRRLGPALERRQAVVSELELQRRDDAGEVGVAAALAVAVERALYERRALGDRRQRVRHPALGVVVAVDPDGGGGERGPGRAHRLGDLARQRGAVGVAQRHVLGTVRRLQAGGRVSGVVAPAVEEVLGVVDHALALRDQVGDRLGDHRQVLVAPDAHDLLEVQPPRLADERARRRERGGERAQRSVLLRGGAAPAGHAERAHVGAQALVLEPLEQLGLLRVRGREAGLDERDPEVVEHVGDADLLLHGQRHALSLHPVAQGRVVDRDPRHGASAGCGTTSSQSA